MQSAARPLTPCAPGRSAAMAQMPMALPLQRRVPAPRSSSSSRTAAQGAALVSGSEEACTSCSPRALAQGVAATARRRTVRCSASPRPSVFLFSFGGGYEDEEDDDEVYTVIKFQVGVFGDIAKWQRDLARLSNLYDTDEEGGLHAIFQDTLQQLQRNTEYIGYCTSGGRIFNDLDAAESKFNEVSFDERGKFKEETLTNVDGRTASKSSSSRLDPGVKDLDQWICITLLLAVEREVKLPKVQTVWEVKQAIKTLAGIRVDDLLAFECLWTPQDNGDSYSKDELLADYPTMVTLS